MFQHAPIDFEWRDILGRKTQHFRLRPLVALVLLNSRRHVNESLDVDIIGRALTVMGQFEPLGNPNSIAPQ